MKEERLTPQFSWTRWQAGDADARSLPAPLPARLLFDVLLIHEFEHAVLALKNDDCVWGPVHSSVGQEAVAAGVIAALNPADKAFGTHRSHHHFLAKTLQFALPPAWDPATEDLPDAGHEVVFRTLAEIMGLAPGYCGGRGGSMHLRCAEAGFLGSNAIVAGGIPLATGAAFTEKYNRTGNLVVAFFGDGATNQGSFHEALNLAALWKLPVLFFLENNHYAVATHLAKACAVCDLSVRAAAYGIDGHLVDGTDPVALYHATRAVADTIRRTGSPAFIEAKCYRRYHHAGDQPGSAYHYRSKDEESAWQEKETVARFPEALARLGILTPAQIKRIRASVTVAVDRAVDRCSIGGVPRKVRPELQPDPATVAVGVRSPGREWQGVTFREREHFAAFDEMRYSDAIAAVTGRWLEKDPRTFVLGEEVANFGGGAYGATKNLPAKYPDRILNTPISEAGFVGLGLGAAMTGLRPVVEIMFGDFALVAADQLYNQVGKARHMYGNTTDLPFVLRTRVAMGLGYGGQHSMDPVGLYALFSGWRIVAPSNSFDYVGLFNAAMHSLDPALMLEHQALYADVTPVPAGDLDYVIELGKARVVAPGEHVTLIAYSSTVPRCERLLPALKEAGISAELIDLRSIDYASIDYEAIGASLRKTGAAVIVEEAVQSHSLGGVIARTISERFFDLLDGPVACLTSKDVPPPVSRVLEAAAHLSDQEILDTAVVAAKRRWR